MGTFDVIAEHLILAVKPLKDAFASGDSFKMFLYRLGWQADDFPPAWNTLITAVDNAVDALEGLSDDPTLEEGIQLLRAVVEVFQGIKDLDGLPPGITDPEFLNDIKERLFELLLADYLAAALPMAYNILALLGIIETTYQDAGENRPSHISTDIKWSRFATLFTEPEKIPETVFGWGTDDFEFERLAGILAEVFYAAMAPVSISRVDKELGYRFLGFREFDEDLVSCGIVLKIPFAYVANKEVGLALLEVPGYGDHKPGLIFQPLFPARIPLETPLREDTKLTFGIDSNITSQFGFIIRPDGVDVSYPFEEGSQLPEIGFEFGFDYSPTEPRVVLGQEDSTHLETKGAYAGFGLRFSEAEPEAIVIIDLKEFALVLGGGDSDSFINRILGEGNTRLAMNLGIEWSSKHGVNFKGGGGLEVAFNPHLSIGPISVEQLQLALKGGTGDPPYIKLEMGAGIKGELGPLTALVQGIGLQVRMDFREGNAGPVDFDIGFRPPDGIGLSIDGGGFKGGGFLLFEHEEKRYAGVLELEFSDSFALKAIGLLTTRMPDGSKGFSLLIIISVEFTPIQLGYGFSLNGVGGLLGLNRTARIEILRDGVRDGSIANIMFPEDVVANAMQIISDLRQIFPPEESRFVFGPFARIGWGVPTLLTIDLGLIIEVPCPLRIAILGVLRVILPDEEVELIKIQVNFLGSWEQDKKLIAFDASLFDSKILTMTLAGDMALRIAYGDNPNFLLSVGGFHPAYTPPPLSLPDMRRLQINLFGRDNPRLTIEAYFAVTSNSVQFGAKAELYAAAWKFNVYGFLGFDVLFQFSPFKFIAAIYAGVAVRIGTVVLLSINLELSLEGPTPWVAAGKASFCILFIKIKVSFSVTWGDKKDTSLPDVAVMPLLIEALSKKNNWEAKLPQRSNLLVTLNKMETMAPEDIVAHPAGDLVVNQKVVPLNHSVTRFGNQKPADGNRFVIETIRIDDTELTCDSVHGDFAPAQFEKMDDAQKLSRKSFEKMDSGVRITMSGKDDVRSSKVILRPLAYETTIIDTRFQVFRFVRFVGERLGTFLALLRGNAVAKSSLSKQSKQHGPLAPGKIITITEGYVVVNSTDLKPAHDQARYASQAGAYSALAALVAENPANRDKFQVVAEYLAAKAA